MRILHLGKYYPPAPGGIESHVQTLARGQADLGHDVTVLCVNHSDQGGNNITHFRWRKTASFTQMDGNVRVERVGRWFGVSRLEVCPGLIKKLRTETERAEVVHLHTPNPLMLTAWWLAGNRKTPLVVTHHSDVIKQRVLKRVVAPIESRVYEAAKLILSDSPNYVEGSTILKKHLAKVEILPLGINLELFLNPSAREQEEAGRLKEHYGDPLWLMVGRMTYYKGYHVALEALAKTKGKLVIVGNGPLEGNLRKQARKLGVTDRVIWMSSVSESQLISHYHAATALWFPSIARSEGFGLVQVEAMACGCPVINTEIPGSGVSWVSLDGVSGLTIAIDDHKALAKASHKLMSDVVQKKKLSDGAIKRAAELFGDKKMISKSIQIYQGLVFAK